MSPTSLISTPSPQPYQQLSAEEILTASTAARKHFQNISARFSVVTLDETNSTRSATLILHAGEDPTPYLMHVSLPDGEITSVTQLQPGIQPVLTPDDCFLAESIVKSDSKLQTILHDRYGLNDMDSIVADPWSVHVAGSYGPLEQNPSARLVQTFLYIKHSAVDNHYAHPVDILPVVDLHQQKVVAIEGQDRPAPEVPKAMVNYHHDLLNENDYLQQKVRADPPKALNILQPDGPSFVVEGNDVSWQKWTFTVGFNYREGVVLHDVHYDGRSILKRGSLVEMAVPYADPHTPFQRKCAFDVGDYGLGYCTNSLKLGCDCLGTIHYFDAVLADSKGNPYTVEKAVCMHEEDTGLLYKHVEYRTGHSESRRARRLVVSFIATVVNYEYLFYWYLHQDGSLSFEIKLSGELSTNLLSEGEQVPSHGVMVAPGVNAQIHQHMFCARLEMAVDGPCNSVSEIDFVPAETGPENPYGNAFNMRNTLLTSEKKAQRDMKPGRTWRVFNPSKKNEISGKTVAYKLIPYTFGSAQPPLLTSPECAVTKRGRFATKSLWVTPYQDDERFPAGEFPTQSVGEQGLSEWTEKDRNVTDEKIVIWHSFGVAHVPRTEDFPVMPCESTGFTLKPDCFFMGNPGIDLPADSVGNSVCCS